MIPPTMEPDEVLEIATIKREFVEKIAPELENYVVVLTGDRLRHIRASRQRDQLAFPRISKIPEVLTAPNKVCKNREDPEIANFYKWDPTIGKYLRVTLWINVSKTKGKSNSVLGFRVCDVEEVEKDIRKGLLIYKKE